MEQTNSLQVINIPTGNPQIVIDIIADFNSRYKTNFSVKSVEDRGGVEFVIVNVNEATIDNNLYVRIFSRNGNTGTSSKWKNRLVDVYCF